MSCPIFIQASEEQTLMPIAIAYTRQLLQTGKATLVLHYALTIVWLAQLVPEPSLRPVLLGVTLHRQVEYTDSTVMGIGQATHSSRKLPSLIHISEPTRH